MKIAIASQNRRSVTQHAGRCRHFFIFDTETGSSLQSLNLELNQVLRDWQHGQHPLLDVQTLIAGSIGKGVIEKLERLGIRALITSERDVGSAVSQFLDGTLPILPVRMQGSSGQISGTCTVENNVETIILSDSLSLPKE